MAAPLRADRVNIANAKLFNLLEDLDMASQPSKFNTAIVIFFVPYVSFELVSNVLLKRFKPSTWLSLNMFLFGFTTMMQGLVQNYSGLLATRFFLGLFESGMFPGGECACSIHGSNETGEWREASNLYSEKKTRRKRAIKRETRTRPRPREKKKEREKKREEKKQR